MVRAFRSSFSAALTLALVGLATPASLRAQSDNPWVEEIAPDEEVDLDVDGEEPRDEAPDSDPKPGADEGHDAGPSAPVEPPDPLDVEEDPRPPPRETTPPPKPDESGQPPWLGEVELRQGSWAGILERWDARRAARRASDPGAYKRATSILEEGLRDYGVHGQPGGAQAFGVAEALVLEARHALAEGDGEAAAAALQLASRVAPDLPAVHVARAQARWKTDSDIGGAVGALLDAAGAVGRQPALLSVAAAEGLSVAIGAWLCVLLVAALLLLARAFRYLVFDLYNALPRGAARWQLTALVVLLAVVPVVLGVGPVLSSLWWLTLSWVYLVRKERLAIGVLGALAIGLPFAVQAASALWVHPGSRAAEAGRALVDVAADDVRAALRARPVVELSWVERAALASADKREGRLEEAYEAWRKLAQEHLDAGWAHNNLGVVAALLGREAHALAEFEAAREKDPTLLEAAFNISLLHLRNGRNAQGAKLADEIAAQDALKLEAFRSLTFKRPDQAIAHNRAFIDAPVPQASLGEALSRPHARADAVADEVARMLYVGLPAPIAAGALGAFLALWFLLARFAPRLMPSHPCVRCGSAASRRYDSAEVPPELCSACFHAFVAKGARVEAGMKLRKERQVAAHQRGRRAWSRALTLLWPGLGHLYAGAPVLGLLFALPFGAVLAAFGFLFGPIPWPALAVPGAAGIVALPLVLFLVVLYPVALRSVARQVP